MPKRKASRRTAVAALCLMACFARPTFGQDGEQLTANRRLLPNIGPGLRAVKVGADGRTYVLASPSPGLLVFDAQNKQVLAIEGVAAGTKSLNAALTFGEDCDVDDAGRIYIADRGANLVQVFSPEGALLRSMRVEAPLSVAVLPEGEVAVAALREPPFGVVFGKKGRDVGGVCGPGQLPGRGGLKRFLYIGRLARGAHGS